MTRCYMNIKLKIMQSNGEIDILTPLPIQLSPWKKAKLPLLKLVSCIETSSSLSTKP